MVNSHDPSSIQASTPSTPSSGANNQGRSLDENLRRQSNDSAKQFPPPKKSPDKHIQKQADNPYAPSSQKTSSATTPSHHKTTADTKEKDVANANVKQKNTEEESEQEVPLTSYLSGENVVKKEPTLPTGHPTTPENKTSKNETKTTSPFDLASQSYSYKPVKEKSQSDFKENNNSPSPQAVPGQQNVLNQPTMQTGQVEATSRVEPSARVADLVNTYVSSIVTFVNSGNTDTTVNLNNGSTITIQQNQAKELTISITITNQKTATALTAEVVGQIKSQLDQKKIKVNGDIKVEEQIDYSSQYARVEKTGSSTDDQGGGPK
ncbi:MAG: hypothetical protein P4L16_06535 [Chlamydiales bacterium]|nr:hypothetical protein [Chlamydiales bacterium]